MSIEGETTEVIISPSRTTTPTTTAADESDTAVVHITRKLGKAAHVTKRSIQKTGSFFYRLAVSLYWLAGWAFWFAMRLFYGVSWGGHGAFALGTRFQAMHAVNAPVAWASFMMAVSMLLALINTIVNIF